MEVMYRAAALVSLLKTSHLLVGRAAMIWAIKKSPDGGGWAGNPMGDKHPKPHPRQGIRV